MDTKKKAASTGVAKGREAAWFFDIYNEWKEKRRGTGHVRLLVRVH
jgi:hypothetical protein